MFSSDVRRTGAAEKHYNLHSKRISLYWSELGEFSWCKMGQLARAKRGESIRLIRGNAGPMFSIGSVVVTDE